MKKLAFVLGLITGLSTPVSAESWQFVTANQQQTTKYYLDNDSIKFAPNDVVYFWTLRINEMPQRGVKAVKGYHSMSCPGRVWRTRKLVDFGSNGKVVAQFNMGDKGILARVDPDTIAGEYWKTLCR